MAERFGSFFEVVPDWRKRLDISRPDGDGVLFLGIDDPIHGNSMQVQMDTEDPVTTLYVFTKINGSILTTFYNESGNLNSASFESKELLGEAVDDLGDQLWNINRLISVGSQFSFRILKDETDILAERMGNFPQEIQLEQFQRVFYFQRIGQSISVHSDNKLVPAVNFPEIVPVDVISNITKYPHTTTTEEDLFLNSVVPSFSEYFLYKKSSFK